jgi:hypothetical protein
MIGDAKFDEIFTVSQRMRDKYNKEQLADIDQAVALIKKRMTTIKKPNKAKITKTYFKAKFKALEVVRPHILQDIIENGGALRGQRLTEWEYFELKCLLVMRTRRKKDMAIKLAKVFGGFVLDVLFSVAENELNDKAIEKIENETHKAYLETWDLISGAEDFREAIDALFDKK